MTCLFLHAHRTTASRALFLFAATISDVLQSEHDEGTERQDSGSGSDYDAVPLVSDADNESLSSSSVDDSRCNNVSLFLNEMLTCLVISYL